MIASSNLIVSLSKKNYDGNKKRKAMINSKGRVLIYSLSWITLTLELDRTLMSEILIIYYNQKATQNPLFLSENAKLQFVHRTFQKKRKKSPRTKALKYMYCRASDACQVSTNGSVPPAKFTFKISVTSRLEYQFISVHFRDNNQLKSNFIEGKTNDFSTKKILNPENL